MSNTNTQRFLIDVDGVLTDGRLTIDHTGVKCFKQFYTRDVRSIRELVYNGWEVILVTADDWIGIYHFADKVGADVVICRQKDGELINLKPFYAVGDDAWDVAMLRMAEKAYCPKDADPSVKVVPGITVLPQNGGSGVVAGLLPLVLD